jgi:hypothetical protein
LRPPFLFSFLHFSPVERTGKGDFRYLWDFWLKEKFWISIPTLIYLAEDHNSRELGFGIVGY